MSAVVVEGLIKRYGDFTAVDSVSFEVAPGEVFALLGPNGAGKTTTLEILEGFRERDGGQVSVLGFDPADRRARRPLRERLGIVLQELAVENYLTVREVLERSAAFYPNPREVDEVIEVVGLSEKADARVKSLSGGQQRRLDVGLGIVGNPELIFLDEPTTGFDPSARRGAWELVRSLRRAGTAIILTTHYMDEAEALADRLAVIARGRIVATGTPDTIGGRDVSEVTIRFRTDAPELPPIEGHLERRGDQVQVHTDDEVRALHQLTSWALERDEGLQGLSVERLTLEDVYLRLTGPGGASGDR